MYFKSALKHLSECLTMQTSKLIKLELKYKIRMLHQDKNPH